MTLGYILLNLTLKDNLYSLDHNMYAVFFPKMDCLWWRFRFSCANRNPNNHCWQCDGHLLKQDRLSLLYDHFITFQTMLIHSDLFRPHTVCYCEDKWLMCVSIAVGYTDNTITVFKIKEYIHAWYPVGLAVTFVTNSIDKQSFVSFISPWRQCVSVITGFDFLWSFIDTSLLFSVAMFFSLC